MYRPDKPDSTISVQAASTEASSNLLADTWCQIKAHPYLAASAGAGAALAGIAAYRFAGFRAAANLIKGAGGLEESGTAAYVRDSGPELESVLNHVLPLNLRVKLTQRSPMYSQELATRFSRRIESAFPNVDAALQRAVSNFDAAPKMRWGNQAAVENFEQELERIKTAVRPVIESTAKEAGFPAPVFDIHRGIESRGRWKMGFNSVIVNPETVTKTGDFATTSYHELTHAEQTHLVTRKLADNLGLPTNPTAEQRAQLLNAYNETMHVDTKTLGYRGNGKQRLESYIDESLNLRNGIRLSGEQEARANDLLNSYSNSSGDPWRSRMAQHLQASGLENWQKKHLLYRSNLREIEAWTAAGLVS